MPNLLSALDGKITIHIGDCRETLRGMPAGSVHCVVTSPPYYCLRDYGHDGQIGLEETPDEYVANLVAVFREVRRVLRADGTLWLNLGDSYSSGGRTTRDTDDKLPQRGMASRPDDGLKPKDLIGIPWRVAFALQADGWYLRQDIIWHKPNPMPESVRDRCSKAHEYIFLLSKGPRYYYDAEAVREPAVCDRMRGPAAHPDQNSTNGNAGLGRRQPLPYRNRRSVWTVPTNPYAGAHFATYPPDLIEPCIRAGSPSGGIVLDPFGGAGTTGLVAARVGRRATLLELNPAYADMARLRIETEWMGAASAARERALANGGTQSPAGDLFDFAELS